MVGEEWDFIREMQKMQNEFDRLFEGFWGSPKNKKLLGSAKNISKGVRQPIADVYRTGKNVIAKIELPGVDKKDIEVNITEDSLEVKSEKEKEKKIEKKDIHRYERSYSGFYRYFTLPAKVKPEKATAEYKNGILKVTMPKLIVQKAKSKKLLIK